MVESLRFQLELWRLEESVTPRKEFRNHPLRRVEYFRRESSGERSNIANEPRQLQQHLIACPRRLKQESLYTAWRLDCASLLVDDDTARTASESARHGKQLLLGRCRCFSFKMKLRDEPKPRQDGLHLRRDILGRDLQRTIDDDLPAATLLRGRRRRFIRRENFDVVAHRSQQRANTIPTLRLQRCPFQHENDGAKQCNGGKQDRAVLKGRSDTLEHGNDCGDLGCGEVLVAELANPEAAEGGSQGAGADQWPLVVSLFQFYSLRIHGPIRTTFANDIDVHAIRHTLAWALGELCASVGVHLITSQGERQRRTRSRKP